MALTWSLADIADWKSVCNIEATQDEPMHGIKKGDTLLNPVTSALIWHSLNTGIGRITEENAGEVYARISFVEKLYGASLLNSDGERPITMNDIVVHIGLSTNASFKAESRASFLKRHAARKLDDSKRYFENDRKKALAEAVA